MYIYPNISLYPKTHFEELNYISNLLQEVFSAKYRALGQLGCCIDLTEAIAMEVDIEMVVDEDDNEFQHHLLKKSWKNTSMPLFGLDKNMLEKQDTHNSRNDNMLKKLHTLLECFWHFGFAILENYEKEEKKGCTHSSRNRLD
ncbi:hypothetical protein ACJX0J_040589, partial [Zea mays]